MITQDVLNEVEKFMLSAVQSDVPILQTTSQYIIGAGGKRLRPRIMFLSYLASGGRDLMEVIPVAAALELLHTATLVHDDINDDGHFRRGKETINERWGIAYALLTGDYLFTRVYQIMADYPALNRTLADTSIMLVEGEALQATASDASTLNHETYIEVVEKKTAALFNAAAVMGAQLAGASDEVIRALSNYGTNLGLVFQLVDDILDIVGDPLLLGKSVGVDITQGKGVAAATINTQSFSGNPADFHGGEEQLTAIVSAARVRAQTFAAQAILSLEQLGEGAEIDELKAIVKLALNRST